MNSARNSPKAPHNQPFIPPGVKSSEVKRKIPLPIPPKPIKQVKKEGEENG